MEDFTWFCNASCVDPGGYMDFVAHFGLYICCMGVIFEKSTYNFVSMSRNVVVSFANAIATI